MADDDITCDCDQCRLASLILEFKQKGADPIAILTMVGEILQVLYGVEVVDVTEVMQPDGRVIH